MLDDLGGEITLAIEKANLLHLTTRQSDAAREERLRIARNLHDTVGQNLSYLRLKLDQLRSSAVAAGPAEFQDELGQSLGVADEVYEQLRDTLEELRKTDQLDLEQSIRQYAAQVAERSPFSVRVETLGQLERLSTRRSRQITYIVREALNNVEKHAGAENVAISLRYDEGEFSLSVRDDGQGFRPDGLESDGRFGIIIMEERARAISGELTIKSAPGEGTEVALRLPRQISVAAVPGEP
jgi:signal transduction histidine kinase